MFTVIALLVANVTAPSDAFRICVTATGGVSADMLQCGSAEIARVDLRLNSAYAHLMKTLPEAEKKQLRVQQRAWLGHHLREVRRLARNPDNGSLAFIDSQRFELEDLGKRTVLLERMLAEHR